MMIDDFLDAPNRYEFLLPLSVGQLVYLREELCEEQRETRIEIAKHKANKEITQHGYRSTDPRTTSADYTKFRRSTLMALAEAEAEAGEYKRLINLVMARIQLLETPEEKKALTEPTRMERHEQRLALAAEMYKNLDDNDLTTMLIRARVLLGQAYADKLDKAQASEFLGELTTWLEGRFGEVSCDVVNLFRKEMATT